MSARDEREISAGVFGWLESPSVPPASEEWVCVSGWAFSRSSRLADVFVFSAFGVERIQYGLRRDDVHAAYPADPAALHSGFFAFVNVPVGRSARLEVRGRLEDGREVHLFSKTLSTPYRTAWTRRLSGLRAMTAGIRKAFHDSSGADLRRLEAAGELGTFLDAADTIRFTEHQSPRVSIVLVLWNRAELTYRCLRSIAKQAGPTFEVVIIDNDSGDRTGELLSRVSGATGIRNAVNLGFGPAVNIGVKAARGELLLFLNNDAELRAGALEALVRTIDRDPAVGAVGGKLIYPNGRLQEAGAIIWQDGSCDAYGRNDDPASSRFNFQRDVDYCSAALLLTRRNLFTALGGFDERFKPAYYEDVDYCARLWTAGRRVVYSPAAEAVHVEFGSSPSRRATKLQEERRGLFWSLHREWVQAQPPRNTAVDAARTRKRGRPAILVIDDAWPGNRRGSGFPRAAALLRALVQLNYLVTSYPMDGHPRAALPVDDGAEVEVVDAAGVESLSGFLQSRQDFDAILVSRPHNLRYLRAAVGNDLARLNVPVIYDAEAVYAVREAARLRLDGIQVGPENEAGMVRDEIALAGGCCCVLTVNEAERSRFVQGGVTNVRVVGHALVPSPTSRAFQSRRGLLFVGALQAGSPNEDAVLYFVREVLPLLPQVDGAPIPITIVGAEASPAVSSLAASNITVVVDVPELMPFYDAARVLIAPTRFSAGISLKLLEAAAFGVPIACTPQLARQLEWTHGREVLVGENARDLADVTTILYTDPYRWGAIRTAALGAVTQQCAPHDFRSAVSLAVHCRHL